MGVPSETSRYVQDQYHRLNDELEPSSRPSRQFTIKEVRDNLKAIVRSSHSDEGVAISALQTEYLKRTGEPIPLYDLNYESIYRLLWEIPEIQSSRGKNGEPRTIWHRRSESRGSSSSSTTAATNNTPIACTDGCYCGVTTSNSKGRRGRASSTNRTASRRSARAKSWGRKSVASIASSRRSGSSTEYTESEYSKSGSIPESETKPFIVEDFHHDLNKRAVYEPQLGGAQLMGDDYFLQLSLKYSKDAEFYRKDKFSGITCGMVQSGQSIRVAADRLKKVTAMSNKLTICLGSVDIYENRKAHMLIEDYQYLLMTLHERYQYSPSSITLCAIPQLPNVSLNCLDRLQTLNEFNNWLQDYAEKNGHKFIDFAEKCLDNNLRIRFDLYQSEARLVSGCKHPYILWNFPGRQMAVKLLLDTDPAVPALAYATSDSFNSSECW